MVPADSRVIYSWTCKLSTTPMNYPNRLSSEYEDKVNYSNITLSNVMMVKLINQCQSPIRNY